MVLLMHPKCVCEQADWKKTTQNTEKKICEHWKWTVYAHIHLVMAVYETA